MISARLTAGHETTGEPDRGRVSGFHYLIFGGVLLLVGRLFGFLGRFFGPHFNSNPYVK